MTGSFDAIRSNALRIVSREQKNILGESIKFVLEHQWITCPAFPDRLWKVTSGSGMGARHSAALCDAAFAGVGECGFVDSLACRTHFQIWAYYRFRDDIFVHCGCARLFHQWFEIFRKRAGRLYCLELVSVGTSGDMLAATVAMRPPSFSTRPRQKFAGPALCAKSGHPSSIRKWPVSLLKMNLALCTPDQVQAAVQSFFLRFSFFCAPDGLMQFLRRVASEHLSGPVQRSGRIRVSDSVNSIWWLVLPFHPCLEDTLGLVLKQVSADPALKFALSDAFQSDCSPQLRVSWRLEGRALSAQIATIAIRNLRRMVGVGGGGRTNDRP